MDKVRELFQTAVVVALGVMLLLLAASNAAAIRETRLEGNKTRVVICSVVSTHGSPYHFTRARWAAICGDLLPWAGATP
jgi:hypothetical protein